MQQKSKFDGPKQPDAINSLIPNMPYQISGQTALTGYHKEAEEGSTCHPPYLQRYPVRLLLALAPPHSLGWKCDSRLQVGDHFVRSGKKRFPFRRTLHNGVAKFSLSLVFGPVEQRNREMMIRWYKQCKLIAAWLVFHVLFYTILQFSCRSVRHSLFFMPDVDKVRQLSEARVKYAERVLERLGREHRGVGGENLGGGERCIQTFCIGVVGTELRLDRRYLLKCVGSLTGIGEVGTDCRTEMFFVQVRGNPLSHRDEGEMNGGVTDIQEVHADIKLITDAGIDIDYFRPPQRAGQTYFDNQGKRVYGTDGSQKGQRQWFSDENNDYRNAMERCLKESSAPYVVIIEDDVFATKNFMGKMIEAIAFLEKEHERQWSSLKLFVTDYWQNWELETSDVATLIFGGIFFAIVCELTLIKLGRKRKGEEEEGSWKKRNSSYSLRAQREIQWEGIERPHWERKRSVLACNMRWRRVVWSKWFVRTYFVSLGVATMYAVSKQALNLSQVSKRGIYANDLGASTLGIVFPRNVAEMVVLYLEKDTKQPVDVLLLKFNEEVVEGEKKQFVIVPSLLQHTGIFSSSARKAQVKDTMSEGVFYKDHMKLSSKFDDLNAEELSSLEN